MSDVNPYAAPQATVEPAYGASYEDGDPEPWAVGEVLSEALGLFKLHWAPLAGALIVGYVIVMVVQQVGTVALAAMLSPAAGSPDMGLLLASMFGSIALSTVVQAAVMPGWVRLFLMAARGETPVFGVFFSSFSLFPTMLVASVLATLGIYLGILLLVVPGVIVGLGTGLYAFFVADGDRGYEALVSSWEATRGQKGALFVMGLALVGVNILGALACLVGLLVSMPVSLLAMAIVYTRITGRRGPRDWASV